MIVCVGIVKAEFCLKDYNGKKLCDHYAEELQSLNMEERAAFSSAMKMQILSVMEVLPKEEKEELTKALQQYEENILEPTVPRTYIDDPNQNATMEHAGKGKF